MEHWMNVLSSTHMSSISSIGLKWSFRRWVIILAHEVGFECWCPGIQTKFEMGNYKEDTLRLQWTLRCCSKKSELFLQSKIGLWLWLEHNEKVKAKYLWAGLVARWGIIEKIAKVSLSLPKVESAKRAWGGGGEGWRRQVLSSYFCLYLLRTFSYYRCVVLLHST